VDSTRIPSLSAKYFQTATKSNERAWKSKELLKAPSSLCFFAGKNKDKTAIDRIYKICKIDRIKNKETEYPVNPENFVNPVYCILLINSTLKNF